MTSAQLAVIAANVLFVVACGTVGVRLLLLFRRTHGLPEFYLGTGFCCMVASIPCLGASGLGRSSSADVDLVLVSVGLLLLWLSIGTQASFTWTVFRPTAGWAETLVLSTAAAEAVIVGGALHALGSADPQTPSFEAVYDWMFALRFPLAAIYLWTAVEAWIQHRMAKRRARIGLGDPVVKNRIGLWGLNAVASLSTALVSALLHMQGRGPFADARAAALLGLGGILGASCLYLAFMPPRWYVGRIRARAAA